MHKKYLFVLLIIFLFFVYLLSCDEPQGIKIYNEIYDFGEVDEGTEVSFNYEFKNTGKEDLIIEEVRPACGCTVAEGWDKVVLPGKKGKIPITFKTAGYKGEVTKTMSITTNIPGREQITLTVKGIVSSAIDINPMNLWLGEVTSESTPLHGTFEVKSNLKKALKILNIIPPNDQTTYELETIKAGREYRVNVTINPPFEGNEVIRNTLLMRTDNPEKQSLSLVYSYFIPPPVQVYPQKIILNSEDFKEQAIERRVNIKGNTDKPIKVLEPKMQGAELVYSVKEVNPGEYYQIAVTIPSGFTFPEEQPVMLTFKVENDPQDQLFTIYLEKYVQP